MTTPEVKEFDPFESASAPAVQTYDLFGMVEINAWACALVTGQGKVVFDPAVHQKRFTAIDVFIQPLPEIEVRYPRSLESHWIAEFAEWAKITLPSIKAAGFENVREINNRYARIARVPSGKKYPKKDKETGQPTGEMGEETTFKFVEFFADEDECRAMYLANGGQPVNGHNVPAGVPDTATQNEVKPAELVFLEKIVKETVTKEMTFDEAKEAMRAKLAEPKWVGNVGKAYSADGHEVADLITEIVDLPF